MDYDLNRPWLSLDPWQIEYIGTPPEQDCFLLCTRQGGKTTAMSIKAVEMCVNHFKKGEIVLISSLTERQAQLMLAKAQIYAEAIYPKQIDKSRENKPTMHRIMFKSGAGILCYAAGEEGDSTRGYTLKKLLVDEGSRMSDLYFISATPTLSVSKGSMDIASTPHGTKDKEGHETFFYKCSKDENFKKFFVAAKDCPRHATEFLLKEKLRMSALQYKQEYEAEFLDEVQRLFSEDLLNRCFKKKDEDLTTWLYEQRFLGVDVARFGGDKNAFVNAGLRMNRLYVYRAETTNRVGIDETYNKIINLDNTYNFNKILIDDAGVGGGLADFLIKKFRHRIVCTNNARKVIDSEGKENGLLKENMYSNAIVMMEQGNVEILDIDDLRESLACMQFAYKGDRIEIFGGNSHLAEAFVRALWGMKAKGLNLFVHAL